MKYTKPPLPFAEQATLLLNRGLEGIEHTALTSFLTNVNYYRFSAYFFPFKDYANHENFKPGTTFETVYRRYIFDRELRLLLMREIEVIEVAILRTQMVEQFTLLHGPFGYVDKLCYSPAFEEEKYDILIEDIKGAVIRSKEQFVKHYHDCYREETFLPLWMTAELLSYGSLYTIFHNLNTEEMKSLANKFGVFSNVLDSWLHTLNYIRNACAHHSRIWNRKLPIEPLLPDKKHKPDWYSPVNFKNTRVFCIFVIMQYLLNYIEPGNQRFMNNFQQLLKNYPDVPHGSMGIPENWEACPVLGLPV